MLKKKKNGKKKKERNQTKRGRLTGEPRRPLLI